MLADRTPLASAETCWSLQSRAACERRYKQAAVPVLCVWESTPTGLHCTGRKGVDRQPPPPAPSPPPRATVADCAILSATACASSSADGENLCVWRDGACVGFEALAAPLRELVRQGNFALRNAPPGSLAALSLRGSVAVATQALAWARADLGPNRDLLREQYVAAARTTNGVRNAHVIGGLLGIVRNPAALAAALPFEELEDATRMLRAALARAAGDRDAAWAAAAPRTAARKLLIESEWHLFSAGTWPRRRWDDEAITHCRVWLAVLSGQGGAATWYWGRNGRALSATAHATWFAGSLLTQPLALDGLQRAAHRLRAHLPEAVALAAAPRRLWLVVSDASLDAGGTHADAIFTLGEALVALGVPFGFLAADATLGGRLDELPAADWVLLPACSHLSDAAAEALRAAHTAGRRLLAAAPPDGDGATALLGADDRGAPRPATRRAFVGALPSVTLPGTAAEAERLASAAGAPVPPPRRLVALLGDLERALALDAPRPGSASEEPLRRVRCVERAGTAAAWGVLCRLVRLDDLDAAEPARTLSAAAPDGALLAIVNLRAAAVSVEPVLSSSVPSATPVVLLGGTDVGGGGSARSAGVHHLAVGEVRLLRLGGRAEPERSPAPPKSVEAKAEAPHPPPPPPAAAPPPPLLPPHPAWPPPPTLAPPASTSASNPLLLFVAAALGLVTSVLGFYLHRRCCARAPPAAGEAIELTEDEQRPRRRRRRDRAPRTYATIEG